MNLRNALYAQHTHHHATQNRRFYCFPFVMVTRKCKTD